MSYFVPAIAGAALWSFAAYTWNLREQARARLVAEQNAVFASATPEEGVWRPAFDRWGADNVRFKSVVETTDVQGAKVFLVDYGNGSKVIQYNDPRLYLGN